MVTKRVPDLRKVDDDTPPEAVEAELPEDDITDSEVEELPDGSAVVKIEGDKEDVDDPEFLKNLADGVIEEGTLSKVALELTDLIEKDRQARKKRDEKYEEGLRRTGLGDDAPGGAGFEGASKVVHPILAESCIDFESRAIKELFPANGPVKTQIIGKKSEEKLRRADRKATYLNWQTTVQMSEYRPTLEQILTQVPMGGSQYQAFYWDPRMRRPRTEFVPIDDMLLPYACTDFYSSHRVTRVLRLTQEEVDRRVVNGLYRDVLTDSAPTNLDNTAAGEANDKIEGREETAFNEDGLREFYEVQANLEFEDDDLADGIAPYLITIDKHTDKVVAVYRNWDEDDVEKNKLHWIVEWQFIPWRGAYALGLPHLIGGLSGAATGALRALLDSAHINNAASAIKLKSGKSSGQNLTVEPGQIAEIDGPAGADDIRKVMMPMPYNQPSTVLFQLLGWLTDAGKSVIATTEESLSNVGDRTPVGTTMAMVEQGSQTYSAIHARLHHAQARALGILCRINRQYMEDEVVIEELGELVVGRADFENNQDIIPVSDPNIFSESQRYAQVQGIAQVKAMFPELGWNNHAIATQMLRRMKVEDVDAILPPEKKPENLNPVGENVAALAGTPLLAMTYQNHLAHISVHIDFCKNPNFGNPVLGAKLIPTMLEHIKQHIGFLYSEMMAVKTNFTQDGPKTSTREMEVKMAEVQDEVMAELDQIMASLMPELQALQQLAEQMAPKPMMDPSIEATKEVAMKDIERKTARDNAELEIQRNEAQRRGDVELAKEQTKVSMNTQDNQQHQQTELAKNHEDNMTQQWIAQFQAAQEQQAQQTQAKIDGFLEQFRLMLENKGQQTQMMVDMVTHQNDQQAAAEQAEADRQHQSQEHKADIEANAAQAKHEPKE